MTAARAPGCVVGSAATEYRVSWAAAKALESFGGVVGAVQCSCISSFSRPILPRNPSVSCLGSTISPPLGLPARLAPAPMALMRRPRGQHRRANPRNQLAHASSRSPPRRRLIWASVPTSATTGCVPSPHNTAPHGADGRRRGFSISQDMVGRMVAIGESLGYLRQQRTHRPRSLLSRGGNLHPSIGPAEHRSSRRSRELE